MFFNGLKKYIVNTGINCNCFFFRYSGMFFIQRYIVRNLALSNDTCIWPVYHWKPNRRTFVVMDWKFVICKQIKKKTENIEKLPEQTSPTFLGRTWSRCELPKWLYSRVSQNAHFSVKHSMTGGKRKLEWRRVRKYIRFLILFIPWASIFADFRKFYYTTFLMNLHHFDTPKNPRIFFKIIFSSIPNTLRSTEKICAWAHCIFWFWFWALLARIVDEIENSKSKIIL